MDVDALIAALESYRGKKVHVYGVDEDGDYTHLPLEAVADNDGNPIIYTASRAEETNPFEVAKKRIAEISDKANEELCALHAKGKKLQEESAMICRTRIDPERLKEIHKEMQGLLKKGEEIAKKSKDAIDAEYQRAKKLT